MSERTSPFLSENLDGGEGMDFYINLLITAGEWLNKWSQAILAVTSIVALWQIVLAKRSVVVKSKREAFSMAADRCEKFAQDLIPRSMKCLYDRKTGRAIKRWELKDKEFGAGSLRDVEGGKLWVTDLKVKGEEFVNVLDFMNSMESLAMYFANGCAEEKIACPVIGAVFCQWVEQVAPLIVEIRGETMQIISGPYQNTVNLYKIWSGRLSKSKLLAEADQLMLRAQAIKDISIRTIGTE